METILSQITSYEVKELRSISVQTFTDTYGSFNTEEDMRLYVEQDLSIDQLTAELNDQLNLFYLLKTEESPLGFLKLRFEGTEYADESLKGMEIQRFYVLKSHQGKQYGRLLLDFALEKARREKCTYIWLAVWEHNTAARKFYEKTGFSEIGETAFKLGEDLQRDLVLFRKI